MVSWFHVYQSPEHQGVMVCVCGCVSETCLSKRAKIWPLRQSRSTEIHHDKCPWYIYILIIMNHHIIWFHLMRQRKPMIGTKSKRLLIGTPKITKFLVLWRQERLILDTESCSLYHHLQGGLVCIQHHRFGDPILRTCGKVAPVAGSWRMRLHHLGPDIFLNSRIRWNWNLEISDKMICGLQALTKTDQSSITAITFVIEKLASTSTCINTHGHRELLNPPSLLPALRGLLDSAWQRPDQSQDRFFRW